MRQVILHSLEVAHNIPAELMRSFVAYCWANATADSFPMISCVPIGHLLLGSSESG